LAVQYLEISGRTALVAHDGEADRLGQITYRLFLANSHLMEFLISDQSIGHISQGVLNGLLVCEQSLLVLRFGEMKIPSKGAARENGLCFLGAVGTTFSRGAL